MISPCANPNLDLGPYAGVEILCIFFAMALWGVTCMQTFIYFFNNPKDGKVTKLLVLWIWVMDTVHQCLLMAGSYKGNVSGDIYLTDNVRPEFVIQMLFTSLVSVPAQAFFSFRIWKLADRNWVVPVLAVPAILFQLSDGIMIVAFNVGAKFGTQLTESTSLALFIANFASGAAIDIIISVALSSLLYNEYLVELSPFQQNTATLIHRLILFSIATGAWTALTAIATMAMVVAFPNNFIYVGFYFVISPMYCNGLLANLNARSYLRDAMDNDCELLSVSGFRSTTGTTLGKSQVSSVEAQS